MFNEEDVIYRYKYLPFNEGSLDVLLSGTIKYSCPLNFNDPFDCMPYYNEEAINNIAKTRPDLIRLAANQKGMSPGERLANKGKLVANMRKRFKDGSFSKAYLSGIGVVSLSSDPLNILMWSHYADYHKGFIVEFRIPVKGYQNDMELATNRLLPFPVIYSEHRPQLNIGTEEDREIINKSVLTKSVIWRYESEERVIDHDRGPGIHHYNRNEIVTSVIAGMKMEKSQYNQLSEIVETIKPDIMPGINIYKAKEISDEYRISIPEHPRYGV